MNSANTPDTSSCLDSPWPVPRHRHSQAQKEGTITEVFLEEGVFNTSPESSWCLECSAATAASICSITQGILIETSWAPGPGDMIATETKIPAYEGDGEPEVVWEAWSYKRETQDGAAWMELGQLYLGPHT